MKYSRFTLLCLALAAAALLGTGCTSARAWVTTAIADADAPANWIADPADNLCGLDDPRLLSRPAKVQYSVLYRATPEARKIAEKHIDPASPEGVLLRKAAEDRIHRAAEQVRVAKNHCSIWKDVRHADGRVVDDVTEAVRLLL